MHIAEGLLPLSQATMWSLISLPVVVYSFKKISTAGAKDPFFKTISAILGATVFIISAMPIPVPLVGTCSHPTGIGMIVPLVGPWIAIVISSVALALQALFLAHGGISTLGANIFSMGIIGSFSALLVFTATRRIGASLGISTFLSGLTADWCTYIGTALILSLSITGDTSFLRVFLSIVIAFMPTQIPIGILEGFMAMGAVQFISKRRPDIIEHLGRLKLMPNFSR